MLAGWKSKAAVRRNLRQWLERKELDKKEKPSGQVKNWSALPGE